MVSDSLIPDWIVMNEDRSMPAESVTILSPKNKTHRRCKVVFLTPKIQKKRSHMYGSLMTEVWKQSDDSDPVVINLSAVTDGNSLGSFPQISMPPNCS